MDKRLFISPKKNIKFILFGILVCGIAGGVFFYVKNNKNTNSSLSTDNNFIYNQVVYNIQLEVPYNYLVEDISAEGKVLLYQDNQEPRATTQEEEFIKNGGIIVQPLRQIPGTKELFGIFQENEFEKAFKDQGMKFDSEKFVSNQGYDAFKVNFTEPAGQEYVVVDSPIAYWFKGQQNNNVMSIIYNSLKPIDQNTSLDAKRALASFESYLESMKGKDTAKTYEKALPELRTKFPEDKLKSAMEAFAPQLSRAYKGISVRSNGDTAYVRATLEDSNKNVYAFTGGKLKKVGSEWKLDTFIIDKDRPGQPSIDISKSNKKELKKEDLLNKLKK